MSFPELSQDDLDLIDAEESAHFRRQVARSAQCQSAAAASTSAVVAQAAQDTGTLAPAASVAVQAHPSARYDTLTLDSLARALSGCPGKTTAGATNGNRSSPAGGSASPLELVVLAVEDLQRRVAELEDMAVEVEEEDEPDPAPSSKRQAMSR